MSDETIRTTESHQVRLDELLTAAVQRELSPVRELWTARSEDMLQVLADSAEARAQVRAAAMTIRVAGWVGVLALVLASLAIAIVLEHERVERRAAREVDGMMRDAATSEVLRRIQQVCGRR